MLNKFKKYQPMAYEEKAKKKKANEEADKKRKEKLDKAKQVEEKNAKAAQSSKIVELTDEEAAKLQKEIDAEVCFQYNIVLCFHMY